MCGRFNVVDDPLTKLVSQWLSLDFKVESNSNVCPSQTIATVINNGVENLQVVATWGIQPNWAKRLIINAQSETVSVKPTFRNAFRLSRCVVPFTGWYEWKALRDGSKQKFQFSAEQPLLMAGILFENEQHDSDLKRGTADLFAKAVKPLSRHQLVTLTTEADNQCSDIHSRMPLLIDKSFANNWLSASADSLGNLMNGANVNLIIEPST